jgi:hypothetical protein
MDIITFVVEVDMSLLQMFLGHKSNDLCLGGIQLVYSDMEF